MDARPTPLIRLPMEDSRANYLAAFWRWVEILSTGDYQGAIDALHWHAEPWHTGESLKENITTFFPGEKQWSVVIPNERLVRAIEAEAEVELKGAGKWGWFLAQIPLTTEPDKAKDDDVPLMGLAVSFYLREQEGSLVMEMEVFHA